jgi:hypothetical protein
MFIDKYTQNGGLSYENIKPVIFRISFPDPGNFCFHSRLARTRQNTGLYFSGIQQQRGWQRGAVRSLPLARLFLSHSAKNPNKRSFKD